MNISDFSKPTSHPFGMLSGFGCSDTSQKEEFLAWFLSKNIDAGNFEPIKTKFNHSDLVSLGLIDEVGENTYKLNKKSLGLLYSHYGVE